MKNEDVKNLKKLSHEFKIPVSNLVLILETLYEYDKNLSTDKKKEIIQLGIKEIDRLQDLINYFLSFLSNLIQLFLINLSNLILS